MGWRQKLAEPLDSAGGLFAKGVCRGHGWANFSELCVQQRPGSSNGWPSVPDTPAQQVEKQSRACSKPGWETRLPLMSCPGGPSGSAAAGPRVCTSVVKPPLPTVALSVHHSKDRGFCGVACDGCQGTPDSPRSQSPHRLATCVAPFPEGLMCETCPGAARCQAHPQAPRAREPVLLHGLGPHFVSLLPRRLSCPLCTCWAPPSRCSWPSVPVGEKPPCPRACMNARRCPGGWPVTASLSLSPLAQRLEVSAHLWAPSMCFSFHFI